MQSVVRSLSSVNGERYKQRYNSVTNEQKCIPLDDILIAHWRTVRYHQFQKLSKPEVTVPSGSFSGLRYVGGRVQVRSLPAAHRLRSGLKVALDDFLCLEDLVAI